MQPEDDVFFTPLATVGEPRTAAHTLMFIPALKKRDTAGGHSSIT
jgi:hypothetical protein